MKKPIAIIAGEPNSISSEIIFKTWKLKRKYKHKPFFIIGSIQLLNSQMKKLKYNIKIKKIDKNFSVKDLIKNELPVYDVKYNQKKPFENLSSKSNKYIFKCFDIASKIANKSGGSLLIATSRRTGNAGKVLATSLMLLGRLEIFTVMLLFSGGFTKK